MSWWVVALLLIIAVAGALLLVPLMLSARQKSVITQAEADRLQQNLEKMRTIATAAEARDTPEAKLIRLETRLNNAARIRRSARSSH